MIVFDLNRINTVLATQLNRRTVRLQFAHAINQELLEIGLLHVDKGRKFVTVFRQQIEFENLSILVKHFAQIPYNTLVEHRITATIAICNLKAAFRKTNRAATHPDAFMIIQNNRRNTLPPQIKRSRNPNRPTAHNHDRMAHRRARILIGTALIGIGFESQFISIIQHQRARLPQ